MSNRRKEVLTAAEEAVSTFRDSAYGGPEQSFSRIAEYWQVYLNNMNSPLKPHDVAALMILMKIARSQQDPTHFDTIVDIAGYAACWGETLPTGSVMPSSLIDRINSYAAWSSHQVNDDPYLHFPPNDGRRNEF